MCQMTNFGLKRPEGPKISEVFGHMSELSDIITAGSY